MKKFAAILLAMCAFASHASEEVTWSEPVTITGYSVTPEGAPYVEIFFTGATGLCEVGDNNGRATFVSQSNSAEIQKAFVLDLVSAKSRGIKMSFATNEYSVCNDGWGLQVFGIRTEGLTES